jgi:hypothetical protein
MALQWIDNRVGRGDLSAFIITWMHRIGRKSIYFLTKSICKLLIVIYSNNVKTVALLSDTEYDKPAISICKSAGYVD